MGTIETSLQAHVPFIGRLKKMLLDGKWVKAESVKTIESRNVDRDVQ
jgi:hypothetical protein